MTKIKQLKDFIQKCDEELFGEIIKKQVDDLELLDKEDIIRDYCDQKKDDSYRIILKINKFGKIIEFIEPNSKQFLLDIKIQNIQKNYLTPFKDSKLYYLDLTKDIRITKEREKLMKILQAIYSRKQKHGYWLQGKFGVGKTHISIAFLNFLANKGAKVAFIFLPELHNLIFKKGMKEETMMDFKLENYEYAEFLLIDDIGSEKTSEWLRNNILFPILNYREQNQKVTLFTSNLSIDEYRKVLKLNNTKLDSLAVERLLERIKSLSELVVLEGKNYRTFKNGSNL